MQLFHLSYKYSDIHVCKKFLCIPVVLFLQDVLVALVIRTKDAILQRLSTLLSIHIKNWKQLLVQNDIDIFKVTAVKIGKEP